MAKKILTFIFIILTALLLAGCGGTSSKKDLGGGSGSVIDELTAGRIQGIVTAAENNFPIKEAIVETDECQSLTDEQGKYLLGPINAGDYRVIARAKGFEVSVADSVRVLSGRISENVNFSMRPQSASYASDFSIVAIRPQMGTDGEVVSIYCNGCGNKPGKVTFNGKEAIITDWNSTQDGKITVMAPENVESGPVRVVIDGKNSNEAQLFNFIAKPVILNAEPAIARSGQTLTLYGRNFNLVPRFNAVKLADKNCYVNSVSNSSVMSITLPAGAKTGKLSISVFSEAYTLEGVSNVTVTIIPELIYLTPKRALPSSGSVRPIITAYGNNFGVDRNIVRVMIGAAEIMPAEFISFSDNKISFYAPSASVLSPGVKTEVRVKVNQSVSNALDYTAYNSNMATLGLQNYGIYDFEDISSAGTLRLSMLSPGDKIVFLGVLSANAVQSVNEDEYFTISSYMGGNYTPVPTLPDNITLSSAASSRYNQTGDPYDGYYNTVLRAGTSVSDRYKVYSSPIEKNMSQSYRGAMVEPASSTVTFYIRDFKQENPWNAEYDILATGTLIASNSRCLVYYDINQSGLNTTNAEEMAQRFSEIYTGMKNSLGVLPEPEGNIDEQPRIVLFLSPLLSEGGKTVMSYFDSRDKNSVALNSAQTEIIYANSAGYRLNPTEFYASLCESLHKMFYYNQKRQSGVYYGTDWLEAGLSTAAREACGYGFMQSNLKDVERVSGFLGKPYEYGLQFWPSDPLAGNYGMQYLFVSYLKQRCAPIDALKSLEGTDGGSNLHSGLADVENLLGKAGITDFNEFFEDFALAMYCDDLGFDSSFIGYNEDKHQFSDLRLRGFNANVAGLRGGSFGESPVDSTLADIKGNSARLFMYPKGNWGDIEVTIGKTSSGVFKVWVLYYSSEHLN